MDPLILVRFVHFAATVLAAGTVWFAVLAAVPARGITGAKVLHRRFRLLTRAALAVAVLSGAVWLVLVAADILNTPIADVCLHGGALTVLTDTRFGQVLAARLALALLLAALPWRDTRLLQLALAAALIALPALTGHAGATLGPATYRAIGADMAHLIAAGVWLGGLPAFALMLATIPANDPCLDRTVVRTTRRFSTAAIVCVATLAATGLINSIILLDRPADLISTDYGRLLLFKIGLLLAMLMIAAVNRFRLTPQLPAPAARRALTRNTLAETGLGLGVLLLVAALGTMYPGGHGHDSDGAIPPDAAFVHIHSADAMAGVTIKPGRGGQASATIRVMREDFTEFPA